MSISYPGSPVSRLAPLVFVLVLQGCPGWSAPAEAVPSGVVPAAPFASSGRGVTAPPPSPVGMRVDAALPDPTDEETLLLAGALADSQVPRVDYFLVRFDATAQRVTQTAHLGFGEETQLRLVSTNSGWAVVAFTTTRAPRARVFVVDRALARVKVATLPAGAVVGASAVGATVVVAQVADERATRFVRVDAATARITGTHVVAHRAARYGGHL